MSSYTEELKTAKNLGLKFIDKAHVNGELSDDEFNKLWRMICRCHDWMIRANECKDGFHKYTKEKDGFHKYTKEKDD